ncbi:MAG: hypothetical protein E7609_01995 [Ruminococcaceae bacterium]|nr:hypothetical protein [Oscillospiraceae bacterium]
MEISVKDLWSVFKKSALFMVIGAILLSLVFWCYTATAVQKVYRSSAKYILVPKSGTVGDLAAMNNSLVVGGKLIRTLGDSLMNEKTMESVLRFVEERHAQLENDEVYVLENKYTAATLLSLFTFVVPSNEEVTTVFTVQCRAYSAADAQVLLDAFGNVINERSEKLLSGVFHVETSMAPKSGVLISPSMVTNVLLGAILGAVLPYAAILLYSVLDTRIKTEDDVKNRFAYPILGQIPRL